MTPVLTPAKIVFFERNFKIVASPRRRRKAAVRAGLFRHQRLSSGCTSGRPRKAPGTRPWFFGGIGGCLGGKDEELAIDNLYTWLKFKKKKKRNVFFNLKTTHTNRCSSCVLEKSCWNHLLKSNTGWYIQLHIGERPGTPYLNYIHENFRNSPSQIDPSKWCCMYFITYPLVN